MKKRNVLIVAGILVLVLCCAMLVACNKDDIKSLYKPTGIAYDGARLTWNRVELADYYTVSINGGEAKRVNTNVFSYTAEGEFDVTVAAVIGDKSHSESKHFIPLDTITEISISDAGMLSWAEVAGATGYRIQLNGNILAEDVAEPHYQAQVGASRIKVRPVVSGDDSYYSLWSDEKQLTKYSAPTNINYDGSKLTWLGNATNYEVTINGATMAATAGQLIYNSENRDFAVEVKAIGNHTNSFDSDAASESFHYLQPCTDITVEDGILHWAQVENAEGYELRINGVVQSATVTEPAYDKLLTGQQLRVEIRPFNKSGKYFSTWSVEKNVYILQTPTTRWNADLAPDGDANNNFIWNLVNGAAGYEVLITKNGAESKEHFGATITSYGNAYAELGVYTVRVKAVADSTATDYYDSKYSDAITIERLAAPNFVSVTSNPDNVAEGFTVNYTGVQNATGYQLYKDGALVEGKYTTVLAIADNDVVDSDVAAIQEYTYSIRSVGSVKNISGKTYVTLGCLEANALSFKITVLPMPAQLNMSGYIASWSSVSGNNGYAVKHSGATYTSSQITFDLSTLHAGNYDVAVCTRGDGNSTLASNYTAPMSITRLAAPSNIRITYGAGEGLLEYDAVANATGYEVYYDENIDAIPEDAWDNMYQFISTEGTTLSMRTTANKWNEHHTVYYMTSEASATQQFTRLRAPEFPENPFANSTEFVWNAPRGISPSEYTPTYQVYESGVMQTGGEQNGTRYTIKYLDGGKSYTFQVKAIGNDTAYLDSELSKPVSIYKLATPQLTVSNNQYNWFGVTNATAYVLEIDGQRVYNENHSGTGEYHFKPNYNDTGFGEHTVRLYAVGDSGYNNINSDVYEYTQVVKPCLAPEITFKYTHEHVTTGGAIEVEVTMPSENASKYQYEIAGESIVSENRKVSKTMESAGLYYVRVKAIGGTFDAQEVYYTDSQYAGGGSGYTINLLAPPTQSSFSLNSDGVIKWALINGALGYEYEIQYDKGDFEPLQQRGNNALDPIRDFNNYNTITIRIRARGNGTNVITSDWVVWTWTNPNK